MSYDPLNQQEELQKESHQVLEKLNLVEILSKYGKPTLVGSVTLGLMTWKDIDIEVITDNPNKEDIANIASTLINLPNYRIDLTVINNEDKHNPHTPKGIYLGIKYFDDIPIQEQFGASEKVWKIDIWFLTKENAQGAIKTKEIEEKLTDEKRKIILEIKEALATNPKYRKTIFSMDIYNAVLDNEVKNLEEFKGYLSKSGREF